MTKDSTVRQNDELPEAVEAATPVKGVSVNASTAEALAAAVNTMRADSEFSDMARHLMQRDQEIYKHLANR